MIIILIYAPMLYYKGCYGNKVLPIKGCYGNKVLPINGLTEHYFPFNTFIVYFCFFDIHLLTI